MDGIMQALMGGDALTDDDKMQEVANQLRQSDNAAQIFSMSTIAPIANAAKKQRGIIQDAALRGGRARQLGLEKMRARQQEKDRIAREAAIRQENMKREDAQRAEDRANALSDKEAERDQEQRLQEIKYGGSGLPNMGTYEARKLREDWTTYQRVNKAYDAAKNNKEAFGVSSDMTPFFPEWSANAGIEGLRALQNRYRNDPQKQARIRVLLEAYINYNALAGANLSARELERLKPALVNPNDSYSEVMNKMEVMRDISNDRMKMYNNVYNMSGNQRYMDTFFPTIPGAAPAGAAPAGAAPAGAAPVDDVIPKAALEAGATPESWAKLKPEEKEAWR